MNGQSEPAVLINVFEVPAEGDDAFVESWERARDLLREQPGYISTALHQTLMPQTDFRWVNIALWESPGAFGLHRSIAPDADFRFINVGWYASTQAFRAAISSPGFQETARRIPFRPHPGLYQVVRQ
jgi:heme-degrading monooxygenase HmoA